MKTAWRNEESSSYETVNTWICVLHLWAVWLSANHLTHLNSNFPLQDRGRANASLSPIFGKVLLELALPICLHIAYGCSHCTMSDLTSLDGDHMPCKAENIRSQALNGKGLPAAAWEQSADRPHPHWDFCQHDLHSTQAAGQSYFRMIRRQYLSFSPDCHPVHHRVFQRLHDVWCHNQLHTEADTKYSCFPLSQTLKRFGKKNMPLFWLNIFFL